MGGPQRQTWVCGGVPVPADRWSTESWAGHVTPALRIFRGRLVRA